MTVYTVTIDGPAGVGKSTLARKVASLLGIAYLDTGAMFRTIGLRIGDSILTMSEPELSAALAGLAFSLDGSGDATVLLCNGQAAGQEIRTEEAGMRAAKLAALPPVRAYLKDAQRQIADHCSLVAEGRDMGSVVFPQAAYKFFLDASPEVRAMRRLRQLEEAGIASDLQELTEQIRQRDDLDRNRPIAPLCAADDAVVIDTSNLSLEEVLSTILSHIRQ